MRFSTRGDASLHRWRWRAVVLSAVAGLIHMLVTPLYFQQWIGYGAFFVATATLQVMGAMALAVGPPNRIFYWAGIVGNSFVVLLWAITRTVGIPVFGPAAGQILPVGAPDLLATFVEVALVVHLVVILGRFRLLNPEPLVD